MGGSVSLAPDYDAADSTPTSEQQMASFRGASEDVSWKDISTDLLPSSMYSLGPKKFIRTAGLGANQDIKTYDVGSLFVATTDGTPGPAGVLWAEYDIEFFDPQIPPGGLGSAYQHLASASGATTANPLSTSPTLTGNANFGSFTGNVFTFSVAGRFNCDLWILAATSSTMAASTVGGGGVVVDYGGTVGSGDAVMEDVVVVDAVIGTTITYPVTIVGAAGSDYMVIPIQLVSPF